MFEIFPLICWAPTLAKAKAEAVQLSENVNKTYAVMDSGHQVWGRYIVCKGIHVHHWIYDAGYKLIILYRNGQEVEFND